jgi:asparagine synthase (glutamine-hydrolysing)
MCGLTGYISLQKAIVTTDTIKEMLLLQKHRGPDDSGIVFIDSKEKVITEQRIDSTEVIGNPSIAFGFNRLSILDLSANGHQPMRSQDSNVVLMMNGEVYNAIDYREELIQKGYHFKSTTDTEVVLNLYLEYGLEETVNRLNGMFAIVIYDKRTDKVVLFRDRFGIKPLYFLHSEDYFAFSSELKSFKALPNFVFELDKDQLDEYLIFRNSINKTLLKGIKNAEQGVVYSFDLKHQKLSHQVFFDINEINTTTNETLNKQGVEALLKEAVKYQLISDVTVGTQLSGGIDSSLVTHYAKEIVGDKMLESVSIVFDNKYFSEEKYIDFVAEKENLKSNKFTLKQDYYIDSLLSATWHFEQPINHPNTIGIYLLSEQAKKHVTVLLSGEGADEIFGGYGSYADLKTTPYFTFRFLQKLKANFKDLIHFSSYYFTVNGRILMSAAFGNVSLSKQVYKPFSFKKAIKQRKLIVNSLKGCSFNKQRKFDFLTYLPDLLMRQDKMSMAHSIENRVPFLDNNLVDKAFTLSENKLLKTHSNKLETKFILKEISESVFGEQFTFREKQGFGIPLKDFFLSDEFKKLWVETVYPNIKKRAIFDGEVIENWYQSMDKLSYKKVEMFWIVISFEIWALQYLDR